jgi:hypothetical protein
MAERGKDLSSRFRKGYFGGSLELFFRAEE